MGTIQNGRRFSSEFAKATEVNEQTRVLIQTTGNPVQYGELSQFKEVINNGMASKEELNQATEGINNNIKENYALITGRYPKLTAGFAQEIVGDGSATPEEFSFRPTAGEDRNVANTTYYDGERNGVVRIEKIKGNSIVYNQLSQNGNLANGVAGITAFILSHNERIIKMVDGFVRITPLVLKSWWGIKFPIAKNIQKGDKVLLSSKLRITVSEGQPSQFMPLYLDGSSEMREQIVIDEWIERCNIFTAGMANPSGGGSRAVQGFIGTIDVQYFYAINLTKMFGAGNEPTTVEEFWQRLPKGIDISEYNEGTIIDGNYGGIKTVGFNAFNGTYAKVCGGCPYYLGGNYTSLGFTTEEGGALEAITIPTSAESVGTTPSDRLYTPLQNGYIYAEGENININISWGTEYGYLNGTYQPYKPFTRDLSWVNKYFPATINGETKYGMRSAGSVRDEFWFNPTTQKWEAVQNVGVRAYAEGDAEDTSVTTDGTNTNYALATHYVKVMEEIPNLDFDVSDYGTEELIVAEGAQSAPLVADITYAPNALSTIKQVPDILKRLKALEDAVAQQTTNVEPSNIEE